MITLRSSGFFALLLATTAGIACSNAANDPTTEAIPPGEGGPETSPTTTEPSPSSAPPAPCTPGSAECPEPPPPPPPCEAVAEAADPAADVEIVVDAKKGPHDATPPVTDRKIFGTSIADWQPNDYAPTPNASYLARLKALRPGVLRWPGGHRSQEYVWTRVSTGQSGNWPLTPDHADAFVALAKSVSAEPLIGINVKRGNPQVAADIVHYLNVEKGYGVKYFQVGNEPDLTDDMTAGPNVYLGQLIAFVDAMKAVDPSIQIIGPELLTGAAVGGINGRLDWMTPILAGAGGRIDAISWHYYPLDSAQANPSSSAIMSIDNLFQEEAPDWHPSSLAFAHEIMPMLHAIRDAHAPGAKVWVTELAEDPGPGAGGGISETMAGALWVGDVLGRYAGYGPGAILRWIFKENGHAWGLLDEQNEPRPSYGAWWLYARNMGNRWVDTQTSALTTVAGHATLRDDGALTVSLVNKSLEPKKVHVGINGHCGTKTSALTLEGGGGYGSTTFTVNGQPLTIEAGESGITPAALPSDGPLTVSVPPASIVLLIRD